MSEIKYTKDGKKVAVLGKLNSEESIVQEIFVSPEGQEIPAGENFVAKGLLDKPLESWKDKDIAKREANYERRRNEIARALKHQQERISEAKEKAKLKANALFAFASNAESEQLDLLRAFMSGEITHFWIGGYQRKIASWSDDDLYQIDSWGGRRRVEAVKLVSVFGGSDGNLHYRLHNYKDGSDGGGKRIIPCRSHDEAVAHAQAECNEDAARFLQNENAACFLSLKEWQKIEGVEIPKAAIQKHQMLAEKVRLEKIEKIRTELAELENAAITD